MNFEERQYGENMNENENGYPQENNGQEEYGEYGTGDADNDYGEYGSSMKFKQEDEINEYGSAEPAN